MIGNLPGDRLDHRRRIVQARQVPRLEARMGRQRQTSLQLTFRVVGEETVREVDDAPESGASHLP